MINDAAEAVAAPRRGRSSLWKLLESPLISALVADPVFDFYAGILNRKLTARRIVARVEATRHEAPAVKSFILQPNGHFRGFRAGQHVNLTIEIEGVRRTRCYSPSNAPNGDGTVVLTIKRQAGGLVSNWMHDRLCTGDWVELGQTFGGFTTSADHPEKLLLVAGGSGITPIASLVRDLCARERARDVVVLYYARTRADLIFAEDLAALGRRHRGLKIVFALTGRDGAPGDLNGRFSAAHLDQVAPDVGERRTFVCGPQTLNESVRAVWAERGLTSGLETETFDPIDSRLSNAPRATANVRVSAARAERVFSADTSSSLLVQAERAGLSPQSGCRQGICHTCSCRKRAGVVQNLSTGVISSEPNEDIRLCVSVPLSDVTLDL